MTKLTVFGNKRYNNKLILGNDIKFLTNLGHMDESLSLDDEKKKVSLALKYGIDIIADNSITSYSHIFKKWIKNNFPVMLNVVPIYECFESMENGTFEYNMLDESIDKLIDLGADMLVLHPTLTKKLAESVQDSIRIIKVTSRGGSQIYRYILRYNMENPYYEHWEEICIKLSGRGVAVAIGLSLRSGSIIDDLSIHFLSELKIAGKLIEIAEKYNVPIVVEGVGHVQLKNMRKIIDLVKQECHDIPVKTLGPLLSDRMLGYEHINALLGSFYAGLSGASIIGALFRSEHMGLPSVEEYEESLINYNMMKYILNMSNDDLDIEKMISKARCSRNWSNVLKYAYNSEIAKEKFYQRYECNFPETCTMCGERCAMKEL